MEVPAIRGISTETSLLTLEKPLKVREGKQSLKIGVPKEVFSDERRVAIAPAGVATLVSNGHEVLIEEGAGLKAHFADGEYTDHGAEIVPSAKELYSRSTLVVKVCPPTREELELIQEKQILISALHLGNTSPDLVKKLMDLRVTGIGFEFIQDPDGSLPIVRMMHEISGSMSIQVASRLLESSHGGKGIMLGGISGVPPASVVILGAGVIGEWSARVALGLGARVVVLDTDLSALRALKHHFDLRVTTAVANPHYLPQAVRNADVLIGAMMQSGGRPPMIVTEEMVQTMRSGSIIVDLVIDQGGCIETSHPTTLSDPTYVEHGVIHYCVPNLPSNAARTATYALTNVLVPYLIEIGDAGSINDALWRSASLRNGTYVYRRHLTKKSLAALFAMPHRDIELLIASGI